MRNGIAGFLLRAELPVGSELELGAELDLAGGRGCG